MQEIVSDIDQAGSRPSAGGGRGGTTGPSPAREPRREQPKLSQAELNIEEKSRSNPLTWKGQFSPQLVEAHLRTYAKAGDVVLDPFVGSGTVILEALRLGLEVVGTEINPAAATLARLYAASTTGTRRRAEALSELDQALRTASVRSDGAGALFPGSGDPPGQFLLHMLRSHPRGSLQFNLLEALVVASDLYQSPDWKKVLSRWEEIRRLVESLPLASVGPVVALADARQLPVGDGTVDLVVTSPPYINVFNYHQQYRASVEAIGWDVLPIARSEIGSNRKFRGNRLLTVVQYCLDMTLCLLELRRKLRKDARAIFVVGRESNVRKTAFYNAKILAGLATRCASFDIVLEQERVFLNRFGARIFEDIIHLRPGDTARPESKKALSVAREIAREVLEEARSRAPADVIADLDDAIEKSTTVAPSPMVDLTGQPVFQTGRTSQHPTEGTPSEAHAAP